MLALEHQANIFRNAEGGYVLRIDGRAVADSAARGKTAFAHALFLLNDSLAAVARMFEPGRVRGDTLLFRMEIGVEETAAYYSAELLEPDSRLAARARFLLERPLEDRGLFLSDIMIAEPFPAGAPPAMRTDASLQPKPALLIPSGAAFGVYAEVSMGRAGPDSLRVELELIALDGSPALLRAARWVGKRLGLASDRVPHRLSWSMEISDGRPAPIAITLDPGTLKTGRYFVAVSVSDAGAGGRTVSSRREILLIEP
jgi:hypothetical protein